MSVEGARRPTGFLRLTGDPRQDVARLRNWLAVSSAPPVLIETSGSTGEPKRVVLSREAVTASATATAFRLGTGRWWLALPSSYVAGMMVIVRSLMAGKDPLLGGRRTDNVEADYTSLVPTQLRRLLDKDPAHLRSFQTVLVGGGPIDPELRAQALAARVNIVATYGASETAGGCVYDGRALPGSQFRIDEDSRIALRGPMLFDHYHGDDALTAEVLVDGWFLTSDYGRVVDGLLEVQGRIDDVAISGGVKVPLPAVRRRLLEHPDVEQVEVIGVPHEEWGEAVVALVVGQISRDAARDWVAEVHPREWAPYEVWTLDEFPLLDNGKVDRRRLRGLFE